MDWKVANHPCCLGALKKHLDKDQTSAIDLLHAVEYTNIQGPPFQPSVAWTVRFYIPLLTQGTITRRPPLPSPRICT